MKSTSFFCLTNFAFNNILLIIRKKRSDMTASTLKNRICFLSGNVLKIIAAISMVIDHIGVMFFPYVKIYRILGRLAYPIFAFMIAEGCKYTKNQLKYFFTIFVFAVVIQLVYYLYSKDTYMSILITFLFLF